MNVAEVLERAAEPDLFEQIDGFLHLRCDHCGRSVCGKPGKPLVDAMEPDNFIGPKCAVCVALMFSPALLWCPCRGATP